MNLLELHARCSTRRIQQTQTPMMANLNNRARELRLPLSDMLVVLVFAR